jgi:hypothetical protein
VDVQEVRKLDEYLKRLFGNARIRVVPRPKKDDSAEVYIGEEFVGVIFVDDEDNERVGKVARLRAIMFTVPVILPTLRRWLGEPGAAVT